MIPSTRFLYVLACAALQAPLSASADWSLPTGASVHPAYRGPVPKRADVVFSTRTRKPEAFEQVKAFRATRVEWAYVADKQYIAQMKALAPVFGAATNPYEANIPEEATVRDFEGQPIVNPRMKASAGGGRALTTTHPAARKFIFDRVGRYIEAGANAMEIDDPGYQVYAAERHHGDFNPATLAGFKKYCAALAQKGQLPRGMEKLAELDYNVYLQQAYAIRSKEEYARRANDLPTNELWVRYLKSTVDEFYVELRAFMKKSGPQGMPLSMNLIGLTRPDATLGQFFLAKHADYGISEVYTTDFRELGFRAATVRSLGLGYVPTIIYKEVAEARRSIALMYAWGANPLVPWDVFVGNDASGAPIRKSGTPQEFGDLYNLVRSHPELFEGYELAAVVGIPVPTARYREERTRELVHKLVNRNVPFVFFPLGEGQDPALGQKMSQVQVLAVVNDDADFAPQHLQLLKGANVRRNAHQLSEADVAALAPIRVSPTQAGSPRRFIVPRVDRQGRVVVHLIQPAAEGKDKRPDACVKEIEFVQPAALGRRAGKAQWTDAGGAKPVNVAGTKFAVPSCAFWGVLAVE